MPKKCRRGHYYQITVIVCTKPLQKDLIFQKWHHFENGQNWPQCKGYSPNKIISLNQKLKMPRRCKQLLFDYIRVVMCKKNRSKKHLIFEKWEHFENGKNWPRRKGYSLCKMVSLAQKLKMPKRCEKRFYDHIRVAVCKKPLLKTPNTRKMRAFWKWSKLATTQRL